MARTRTFAVLTAVALGIAGAAVANGSSPVAAAATAIWVQTMDSCSNALGGATYELAAPSGPVDGSAPAAAPASVGTPPSCPLEQGSCVTSTRGCASLTADLPPGTYTLREIATPPANATNPGGYASCEGGSACQSEVARVTVNNDGSIAAVVTSIYPDGTTTTSPTYTATQANPIVWHDFGLGNVTCPTDSSDNVADHNTGTPSSHCAYKPDAASKACQQPFPYQCTMVDANDRFIARLYQQLLGRAPAASEVSYWDGQMAKGSDRGSLGYFFLNSTEFHQTVVQADYQLMVNRGADPVGLAYWTSQLDSGAYNESILAGFAATPEYFAVHGGNNTGFVQSLYSIFLGRSVAANDPGVAYWVGVLNSGTPRGNVTGGFTFSHEFHTDLVSTWYPRYLGRPADPSGQAYWAGVLDRGGRDESIEAGFIGSPEYFLSAAS
jgi:hypothetical protein